MRGRDAIAHETDVAPLLTASTSSFRSRIARIGSGVHGIKHFVCHWAVRGCNLFEKQRSPRQVFALQLWVSLIRSGSVQVLESFGKLWKLKMSFPGPGEFWKGKVFQNSYRKVLDFFGKILKYFKMVWSFYYLYCKT